jgi:hypothetical protein
MLRNRIPIIALIVNERTGHIMGNQRTWNSSKFCTFNGDYLSEIKLKR